MRARKAYAAFLAVAVSLAVAALAPCQAQAGGLANSAWPTFQHDSRHSGRATLNGPQGPNLNLLPLYRARGVIKASPSVGADGTVYLGDGKNMITAIDPTDAEVLWSSAATFKGSLTDHSQPTVAQDGTINVGARDNDLWLINPNGTTKCHFHVPHDGDVVTSPTIGQDGTIYMGSDALGAGWFYAMNPDCTVKWSVIGLGGSLKNVSPTLNQDESIVYLSLKTEAVALSTVNGAEIWRTELADKGTGSRSPNFTPVFANDYSAIYYVSKDGLDALDPADGSVLWTFVPPYPTDKNSKEIFQSAPAIGADGTIYIGGSLSKKSSHLYALNPADGSVKWTHAHTDKGRYLNNQVAIGADGTIYAAFGSTFYAFTGAGNGSGGSVVKFAVRLPGTFDAGPIIGAPGTVYLGVKKMLFKITD